MFEIWQGFEVENSELFASSNLITGRMLSIAMPGARYRISVAIAYLPVVSDSIILSLLVLERMCGSAAERLSVRGCIAHGGSRFAQCCR